MKAFAFILAIISLLLAGMAIALMIELHIANPLLILTVASAIVLGILSLLGCAR